MNFDTVNIFFKFFNPQYNIIYIFNMNHTNNHFFINFNSHYSFVTFIGFCLHVHVHVHEFLIHVCK
jgi:hypothetical protein